jgi:hypothetical protein
MREEWPVKRMSERSTEYVDLGKKIILKCILWKWFKNVIFWDVTSYSLIDVYWCFGGKLRFHLQSIRVIQTYWHRYWLHFGRLPQQILTDLSIISYLDRKATSSGVSALWFLLSSASLHSSRSQKTPMFIVTIVITLDLTTLLTWRRRLETLVISSRLPPSHPIDSNLYSHTVRTSNLNITILPWRSRHEIPSRQGYCTVWTSYCRFHQHNSCANLINL